MARGAVIGSIPGQKRMQQILFFIDVPRQWPQPISRGIYTRGWIFCPTATVEALALSVSGRKYRAVLNLARPDVPQALPEVNSVNTGWELRALLPSGRHEISFEAQLSDGRCVVVWSKEVRIQRRWPAWLVSPPPDELLAFQLGLHEAHPPRPVTDRHQQTPPQTTPRFSIVTPSFNQARWLEETISSVVTQEHVACDYIVQDGGSRDQSVAIIQRHSARIASWESRPDAGQSDAIARAFARTAGQPGDVMAWINSDDFYLPGALAYVARYFARHPEVDVVYGHRIVVDSDSREINRWFLPPHDDDILRLNDFVPQETLFWRRRIWDRAGGIDPSFQFAMDWDLLLRFQAAGARIVRLPAFLACFRVHSEQKSSAQIRDIGQREIDALRRRTFGRPVSPQELLHHPRLLAYLRRSARTQLLWKLGWRR
jgi:GT2 family glycosyltransferase